MTSISTRTKIFREQAGAIKALATARREDGKVFLHADILTALGLPTDKSWQRSLSNWLCKDGIRRRPEYTHKRSDAPEIPALIEDEMVKPVGVPPSGDSIPDIAMLKDIHRKMFDHIHALSNAIADAEAALQDLNVQWWRMTGAVGIHPETDD